MNKQELKDLVRDIKSLLRYDYQLRKEFRDILNSEEEFTEPKQADYPKMHLHGSWYKD